MVMKEVCCCFLQVSVSSRCPSLPVASFIVVVVFVEAQSTFITAAFSALFGSPVLWVSLFSLFIAGWCFIALQCVFTNGVVEHIFVILNVLSLSFCLLLVCSARSAWAHVVVQPESPNHRGGGTCPPLPWAVLWPHRWGQCPSSTLSCF